jgi:hypothetical protein
VCDVGSYPHRDGRRGVDRPRHQKAEGRSAHAVPASARSVRGEEVRASPRAISRILRNRRQPQLAIVDRAHAGAAGPRTRSVSRAGGGHRPGSGIGQGRRQVPRNRRKRTQGAERAHQADCTDRGNAIGSSNARSRACTDRGMGAAATLPPRQSPSGGSALRRPANVGGTGASRRRAARVVDRTPGTQTRDRARGELGTPAAEACTTSGRCRVQANTGLRQRRRRSCRHRWLRGVHSAQSFHERTPGLRSERMSRGHTGERGATW